MAADQEPTAWELMRLLKSVQETLGRMEGRMVTQDSLRSYQESNERRFVTIEKHQSDWTVESRGAHVTLDGKIDRVSVDIRATLDQYRAKQEELERKARDQEIANLQAEKKERANRILSISLSVLAIVGSLVVGVVLNSMGGTP